MASDFDLDSVSQTDIDASGFGSGFGVNTPQQTFTQSEHTAASNDPASVTPAMSIFEKLSTSAVDTLINRYTKSGITDWGKVLGDATAAVAGISAYNQASQPTPVTGYTGGIPKYTAVRTQLDGPSAKSRPGMGGHRYFTDTQYATKDGLPAALAASQAQVAQYGAQNAANANKRFAQDAAIQAFAGTLKWGTPAERSASASKLAQEMFRNGWSSEQVGGAMGMAQKDVVDLLSKATSPTDNNFFGNTTAGAVAPNPSPAPTPAPAPTGIAAAAPAQPAAVASPQTVVGPASTAPKSQEEIAYETQRKQIQDTVASAASPQEGLQALASQGLDYKALNDALSYSGSPLGNQSVADYIRSNAVDGVSPIEGIKAYKPAQVTNFIETQNTQVNPLTHEVANYDTANEQYRLLVQETMEREQRLAAQRGQVAPEWTAPVQPVAAPTPAPAAPSITVAGPAAAPAPAYQKVAGQFTNSDTGDIVTYDSNGVHTSTGQRDPAWGATQAPAPVPQPAYTPPAPAAPQWNVPTSGAVDTATANSIFSTRPDVAQAYLAYDQGRGTSGEEFAANWYRDYGSRGMAKGGAVDGTQEGIAMGQGGFVLPADFVSHCGNGNSEAGAEQLIDILGGPGAAQYIKGSTDGMADEVPASIDGGQKAAVAHGEVYVTPEAVKRFGNGNADAGAKQLYAMMDRIREARTGTKKQGKQIDLAKYIPGKTRFADGGAVAPGTIGTESNLSNWVGPYVTDMLGKGQALSNQPYAVNPGPLTAGISDLQSQAFGNAAAFQTPASIATAANTAGNAAAQYGNARYDAGANKVVAPALQSYQMSGQNAAAASVDPNALNASRMQAATLGNAPAAAAAALDPSGLAAIRMQGATLGAAPTARGATVDQNALNASRMQAAALGASPTASAASFSGPQNISAERTSTGVFDQPSVSQYMSPYMQTVVEQQQREAQRSADVATTGRHAEQTKQGAYGGSRGAIMDAEAARNLALQKGDIQAQGLQSAYQQAQAQFNTDQARGLQSQTANQSAALNAAGQNQQAQYNTSLQNAQFGQQTGLANQSLAAQYGLANAGYAQAANAQNSQQNIQAALQNAGYAQQAGLANQGLQGQFSLANAGYSQAANAQNSQQGLQALTTNAGYNQQANLANQGMQGQYGLANAGYSQAANAQNSQQGMQSALANAGYMQQANLANQSNAFNVGQQNLGANLGIQSLGAGQNMAAQQANQNNAQFGANYGLGALAGQVGAANAQGNLGATQNAAGLANLNTQLMAGGVQRGIASEGIAADTAAFEAQRANPYAMVQFQQSLLQGLPLQAQSYNVMQNPYAAGANAISGVNSMLNPTTPAVK